MNDIVKEMIKMEREAAMVNSTSKFRVGMRVRIRSRRGLLEGVIARMGKQRWVVFCETPAGRIEWSGPPSMMEALPTSTDPDELHRAATEAKNKLHQFRNERQDNLDKRHGDFQVGDEVEWTDSNSGYKRTGTIIRFGKKRWVVRCSAGSRWYIPASMMTRKA